MGIIRKDAREITPEGRSRWRLSSTIMGQVWSPHYVLACLLSQEDGLIDDYEVRGAT
jgi:hypothetical protein